MADSTRVVHRVALDRVLPILGTRHVDELEPADVAAMVVTLAEAGYKRETISKSVTYLAQTLDHAGVDPNPARDKVQVKLPREDREELQLMPRMHRLPLLWLDWSGARVGSVDAVRVGDYDEPRRRVRLRASISKTHKALWVDLPDEFADALEASLGPREDRDPTARLFAE